MRPLLANIVARSIGISRVALYFAEGVPLLWMRKLFGLYDPKREPPKQHLDTLFKHVRAMIDKDAFYIAAQIYPIELIYPESPKEHLIRYPKLFFDAFWANHRAKKREHSAFSEAAKKLLEDVPEYYQRNFHFQTDGYLSEHSAELYSHQTEILFRGTIHLMRRVLIKDFLLKLKNKPGARVLELGSGIGEASEIILRSCPEVTLKLIEMSGPYTKKAKERLKDFKNVKFEVGDAAKTSLPTESQDFVYSVFLLHELPHEERQKVFHECFRVLRPGGVMLHIESLQLGDNPEFEWALKSFPLDFHEPFYTNYIKNPITKEIAEAGFIDIKAEMAFLAKAVMAKKPDA